MIREKSDKRSPNFKKRIQRDNVSKTRVESEIRRLKNRLVEEQDRSAQSESAKRKAVVEISKLRDDIRTLSEELDRARNEARVALEEKRELEERARAVAGLWR